KTPNRRRDQLQIGDQRLVVSVLLEGKKSLLNRFGFQSRRSAHGHKAMLFLPTKRHIGESCSFPTVGKRLIASGDHRVSEGTGHLGRNGIADSRLIDSFDDLSVVEGSVQSQSGAGGGNRRGQFVQHLI